MGHNNDKFVHAHPIPIAESCNNGRSITKIIIPIPYTFLKFETQYSHVTTECTQNIAFCSYVTMHCSLFMS